MQPTAAPLRKRTTLGRLGWWKSTRACQNEGVTPTRSLLTTAMMVTLASTAQGQGQWLGRSGASADSVPRSVLQAEAHGSRHPRATANNEGASASNSSIIGTRERRCVDTELNALRSGDFVAGPQCEYEALLAMSEGRPWSPSSRFQASHPEVTL